MKKITLLSLAIILGMFVFTSCLKEKCKSCKAVATLNSDGSVYATGSASQYCGTSLENVENEAPVNDGTITTKWVCE